MIFAKRVVLLGSMRDNIICDIFRILTRNIV